jgi:hypothetical protein
MDMMSGGCNRLNSATSHTDAKLDISLYENKQAFRMLDNTKMWKIFGFQTYTRNDGKEPHCEELDNFSPSSYINKVIK